MKKLKYLIESLILTILIVFFKLMPPELASNVAKSLTKFIGKRTGANRTALNNVKRAFPKKTSAEHQTIINGMWDNLGRVIGEYAHLRMLTENYCEIENVKILEEIAKNKQPAFFIGLHQANWEVAAMQLRSFPGLNVGAVYRAPNNHWAEKILDSLRDYNKDEPRFPKSSQGVRQMISHLKNNGQIGLLIDQKYNEGVEANFFGHPAMTSTSYIELAKKFDCPIIPVQMERIGTCYFKMTVHPALELPLKDAKQSIEDTHRLIESWISEKPSEWFWVHKRWKDKA